MYICTFIPSHSFSSWVPRTYWTPKVQSTANPLLLFLFSSIFLARLAASWLSLRAPALPDTCGSSLSQRPQTYSRQRSQRAKEMRWSTEASTRCGSLAAAYRRRTRLFQCTLSAPSRPYSRERKVPWAPCRDCRNCTGCLATGCAVPPGSPLSFSPRRCQLQRSSRICLWTALKLLVFNLKCTPKIWNLFFNVTVVLK